MRIACTAAP
ncbi:hypothetical protein YPPY53_0178, partial [Yersinia pestis PY-53]